MKLTINQEQSEIKGSCQHRFGDSGAEVLN